MGNQLTQCCGDVRSQIGCDVIFADGAGDERMKVRSYPVAPVANRKRSLSTYLPNRISNGSIPDRSPFTPNKEYNSADVSIVAVPRKSLDSFKSLKHNKKQKGYTVFSIDDESMEIRATKEVVASFDEDRIRNEFDPLRCKYIIIDYPYVTSEGRRQNKLVLLTWAPDTAPTKQKYIINFILISASNICNINRANEI